MQDKLCTDVKEMLQTVYCLSVTSDQENKDVEILPELVMENMDEEQIWQQVELRNNLVLPQLIKKTKGLLNIDEQHLTIRLDEEEEEDEAEDDITSEEEGSSSEKEQQVAKTSVKLENDPRQLDQNGDITAADKKVFYENEKMKSRKRSEVEDDFFKLDEMEEFLKGEETKEEERKTQKSVTFNNVDDVEIDYFDDNFGGFDSEGSDNEGNNATYKDFFDYNSDENKSETPNIETDIKDSYSVNKEDKNLEDDETDVEEDDLEDNENSDFQRHQNLREEDEIGDNKPKSGFEIRQARLEQRIRDYEDEVLGEKPWQLKGEIVATNRPQNSLLQEVLEYDASVQPPSLITEKTTKCLEDIIKQRIRDKAWDDVERVIRTIKTPQEFRKQLVLDHEKSKLSLAQIYEKEYQNEIAKFDSSANNAETEEPKEHQEIRGMMHNLFIQLDALSNYHFVPKPVAPELKIVTNAAAVTMEEVAPVGISDAKLLAPEEVFRGPKHEVIGKSEETKTDKKRARRKKKNKQRAIHKALEAKDEHRQKLGIPLTKKEQSAKLTKKLIKHRNVQKVCCV